MAVYLGNKKVSVNGGKVIKAKLLEDGSYAIYITLGV